MEEADADKVGPRATFPSPVGPHRAVFRSWIFVQDDRGHRVEIEEASRCEFEETADELQVCVARDANMGH